MSWPRRIVAGAGKQELAWRFDATQLASHARALSELVAGQCPRISTQDGAPCALDVWWLGYSQAHGTTWPLAVAVCLALVAAGCLVTAWRTTSR